MSNLILIVDDDGRARDAIASLLSFEGYETVTAEDGAQALEVAEQRVPDLVITDLMMPRMDGGTLSQRLRRSSATAGIPIVVCSAHPELARRLAPQVVAVLTKPVDSEQLASTVETVLSGMPLSG
jgi:CheY-like chemotaxis protein